MDKSKMIVVFAGILAFAVVCLIAAYYIQLWLLELLVSFAPIATTLLFIGIMMLAGSIIWTGGVRQHTTASYLGVAALLLGVYSFGYILIGRESTIAANSTDAKQSIGFTTFNREFSNDDIERASAYFRTQKSDIVALQETTPEVTKQISSQAGFAYHYNATRLNTVQNTSTALMSKYPILESRTYELESHSSLVRILVDIPKVGKTAFYSLHLTGPFRAQFYNERITDVNSVVNIITAETIPFAIGGDFNTTVYSPGLRHFTSRVASSVQPTVTGLFPDCSRFKGLSILCLRIDHIYIPRYAVMTKTTISPDLGSDHRALTVQFDL